LRRIMLATDFSERSDRALRRAIILARAHDAVLDIVHVVDDDRPRRIVDHEVNDARQLLDELSRTLGAMDRVSCSTQVVQDAPFAGIVKAAAKSAPDLIVIGPHRRRLLRDVFVGTTAERIIRNVASPVILAHALASGPYRHVVVACDLSDTSSIAIEAVRILKLDRECRLTFLHIIDPPETQLMVRAGIPSAEIEHHLEEMSAGARTQIAAAIKRESVAGASIDVRVSGGNIAASVAAAAMDLRADLVVVATSGPSMLSRLMLGSVTEAVLNFSTIDVLAIPARRPPEPT